MPLIILGAIIVLGVLAYIYLINHKEKFVREDEPQKDPPDVIYLPADLRAPPPEAEPEPEPTKDTEENQK